MVFDFFTPIDANIISYTEQLSFNCVGNNILLHTESSFPDLNNVNVVLIGVNDVRGLNLNFDNISNNFIRKSFYKMFFGNWNIIVADLGDIPTGNTQSDTYYVLKNTISYLVSNNIVPIIIGGSQDLTYAIYTGFEQIKKIVNLTTIDSSFDLNESPDQYVGANSYLNNIILQEPNYLHSYTNLGFQTYYNGQDHIELIDKMFFDAYRLGEVTQNIKSAEPILRDSNLVSLDLNSVQSSSSGNLLNFEPNGFSGKEICVLSRYAGLSDKVGVFGIFNHYGTASESNLIAQIIWYFIEGFTLRNIEGSFTDNVNMLKYNVQLNDFELIFYKSLLTQRWWVEVPNEGVLNQKYYMPCGFEDYESALNNVIPDRWWKALKKNL